MPLARVDLDAVRDRVGELPAVERVTVSRRLAGHARGSRWSSGPRWRWCRRARQFVVVDARRGGVPDGAAAAGRPAAGPGRHAGPRTTSRPGRALQVLAALTPQLREQLVEVAVEGPARIRLELRGDRTVVWGDATRSDTKAQVATALLSQDGDTDRRQRAGRGDHPLSRTRTAERSMPGRGYG